MLLDPSARGVAHAVKRAIRNRERYITKGPLPVTIQFLCPRGHLLEADQSRAGQASSCPHCGEVFLIPAGSKSSPAASPPGSGGDQPAGAFGPVVPPESGADNSFFQIRVAVDAGRRGRAAGHEQPPALPAATQPEMVHIPCPAGHELETPREYLGRYAMCPACQAKFWLRLEDSLEYRRRKAVEVELREARRIRLLIRVSILVGIVVIFGLGGLLLLSWMQ